MKQTKSKSITPTKRRILRLNKRLKRAGYPPLEGLEPEMQKAVALLDGLNISEARQALPKNLSVDQKKVIARLMATGIQKRYGVEEIRTFKIPKELSKEFDATARAHDVRFQDAIEDAMFLWVNHMTMLGELAVFDEDQNESRERQEF